MPSTEFRSYSRSIVRAVTLFAVLSSAATSGQAQECPADCSGDRQVTVDEIVSCVNIALGNLEVTGCPECDLSGEGQVTVDEIIRSVNAALGQDLTTVNGVCRVPGSSGLVGCPPGTDVVVWRGLRHLS